MRQGRIKQSTHSQQMHCRTFSNCTRGSDASKVWNAAECKCALEALLKGVLPKGPTEQHRHLNPKETQKNHCNTLRNFLLRGLNKHFSWFLVQMQRKRVASEPCSKAESSSQPTHNKCIAGLSATVPEVQIPDGVGRQQIANAPRRCFWLGVPQNVQQNSPGHLNRKETQKITATY